MDFNPRSRAGSDMASEPDDMSIDISIHAPAQGATIPDLSPDSIQFISIHAPAQGATAWLSVEECTLSISIHAPAQGATHWIST